MNTTVMKPMAQPHIGLLAEYPAPIIYGGLEMYCLRTFNALKEIKAPVLLVDYYDPDQTFNTLHIFGNPPSLYEVVTHAAKTKKVIFTAVFGGATVSRWQTCAIRSLAGGLHLLGQKIDHTRVDGMFSLADHIICLNTIERDFIHQRHRVPPSKMSIIPVGVEDFFFTTPASLFIDRYNMKDFVLFTGNIVRRKNPLRLARVLKKMGVTGVFIGRPVPVELDYAHEFEAEISHTPNLLWIKGLSNQDKLLASAYRASAAFCLPSLAEGQSASSLEALAAKKPVILADLPYSYQSCYDHVLRCQPDDEASIETALRQALDYPHQYSYQLPDEHKWENVAQQVADVYQAVDQGET